jgi:GINS complex subunit 4
MVDTPDLDGAVFVRALEDIGEVRVANTDIRCDIRRGDIWVLRWSAVKHLVLQGQAELV